MHPWIMQNIADQRMRDLQSQADRWRVARSLRSARRALRNASQQRTEPTLGQQAAWARGGGVAAWWPAGREHG
jgi:hypothetical protein